MLVSVLIPTFNVAKLLVEAIHSVLAQTLDDFELIVIDDGSTDDTAQRVAQIEDSRIRYLYKTNGGSMSARNAGLKAARGQYIAQLDADDLWPPNYLEVMIARLQHSEHGLAYCPWDKSFPDGSLRRRVQSPACVSGAVSDKLFMGIFLSLVGTVVKRETLENFFFDEGLQVAGDVDGLLRLSLRTTFLHVPDVAFLYRARSGSLSFNQANARCHMLRVLERFYFRLGGMEHVPRDKALKRLSDVSLRAAKGFLEAGNYRAARFLCRYAFQYTPGRPKAAARWLQAALPWRRQAQSQWQMLPPLPDEIIHG